jgi:hypothetical protein
LHFEYEQFNSNGEDFEPGGFPYDKGYISTIIAFALDEINQKGLDKAE